MLGWRSRRYQWQHVAFNHSHQPYHEVFIRSVKGSDIDCEVSVAVPHDCVSQQPISDHCNLRRIGISKITLYVLLYLGFLHMMPYDFYTKRLLNL